MAFPHFPQNNEVCPVCKTRKDTECILVPVPGTEDGNLVQAKCVHKKCYDLMLEMTETSDENLQPAQLQ